MSWTKTSASDFGLPRLDPVPVIAMDTTKEPEGAEWVYHSYHFSDNGQHIKDDPVNSTNAKVAQLATMHFIQFPKGKCFQAVIMYSHSPPQVTRQPVLTSVHCRGRHDSAGKKAQKKYKEKNELRARSLCL